MAAPDADDDPLAYLERALNAEVEWLDSRRKELAAAGDALLRVNAQMHALAHSPRFDVGIEPVAPTMIASIVEHLNSRTEGPIRSSAITVDEGPGLDEHTIRTGQERIAGGVSQRTLYLDSVVATEEGQRWARAWAEAGEEQRTTSDRLSDFAVFGDEVLLTNSEWADPSSPYLMVRNPMVVSAFIALFDSAWAASVPIATGERVHGDTRLISLMSLGVKDEAIARHLGWSLRTVRRRVAALMDVHGVDTRFQLGAAVARAERDG